MLRRPLCRRPRYQSRIQIRHTVSLLEKGRLYHEGVSHLTSISMASSPSQKQVTCGDVRRSYSAQKCCDDESQEFDVHLI